MKENYKPLIVAVFLVIAGFWVKGAGPQKTDVVEVRGALSGGGASIGPQILGVAKGAEFANPALLAENVAVNTVGVPEGGLPADADFTADGTVQDPGNPMGGLFTPGAPVATGPITYVVKRGDTLSGIAAHFGVSAKTILSANSSIHGKTLRIGLALSIPGVTTPATSTGSSAATDLPNFNSQFIMPAQGYNWGALHPVNAVDIANSCGTPVVASAEGLVVPDKDTPDVPGGWNGGYGNFVLIEHPFGNGIYTRYAHLEQVLVQVGDYVKQGQEIGLMGETGEATGCHVHFEVLGAQNPFAK